MGAYVSVEIPYEATAAFVHSVNAASAAFVSAMNSVTPGFLANMDAASASFIASLGAATPAFVDNLNTATAAFISNMDTITPAFSDSINAATTSFVSNADTLTPVFIANMNVATSTFVTSMNKATIALTAALDAAVLSMNLISILITICIIQRLSGPVWFMCNWTYMMTSRFIGYEAEGKPQQMRLSLLRIAVTIFALISGLVVMLFLSRSSLNVDILSLIPSNRPTRSSISYANCSGIGRRVEL